MGIPEVPKYPEGGNMLAAAGGGGGRGVCLVRKDEPISLLLYSIEHTIMYSILR